MSPEIRLSALTPLPPPVLRAALVAAALALAGCSDTAADGTDMRVDDDAAMDTTPAGTPAPPSLPSLAENVRRQVVVTLDEWSLNADQDELPAGEITLQLVNAGGEPHRLWVEGAEPAAAAEAVPSGETRSVTLQLEPGTYRLLCPDSTDGEAHADLGMSTALLVR